MRCVRCIYATSDVVLDLGWSLADLKTGERILWQPKPQCTDTDQSLLNKKDNQQVLTVGCAPGAKSAIITSHHMEKTDVGLRRPLYPRNIILLYTRPTQNIN